MEPFPFRIDIIFMKAPTIKDVAKQAGVGIGTVSRVINNSPQVREETRLKVQAVIDELGYIPNAAARQLPSGKTLTIGIITPFITLPSFVERLTGIQEVLNDTDYDLVLHNVRSRQHFNAKTSALLSQKRADGLILLSLRSLDDDLWQTNPDLPVVVVDGDMASRYPSIVIDNKLGGEMAAHYLIEHGHTRIGFIGDEFENEFGFVATMRRFEGFQQALKEAGLPREQLWYQFGPPNRDMAYANTRKILALTDRPTAIFAASDVQAFGVLNAAQEMGLRVPDDLAVMGFDDIEAARYMNLTTIHQPMVESGRMCAELLLAWLNDEVPPAAQYYIQPIEVVERGTV